MINFYTGKSHGRCCYKTGDGRGVKKCGKTGVVKCYKGYVCNEHYDIIKFNQEQGQPEIELSEQDLFKEAI